MTTHIDMQRLDEPACIVLARSSRITETMGELGVGAQAPTGRRRRLDFSNTQLLLQRLEGHPEFIRAQEGDVGAPHGRFCGQPIIGRGSHIAGGIYLGHSPREGVSVSCSYISNEMRVYRELVPHFPRLDAWTRVKIACGWVDPLPFFRTIEERLRFVMKVVLRHLPFDEEGVGRIMRFYRISQYPDREIPLGEFIEQHSGVCRHQVCLVGMLLERLCADGHMAGKVSIERGRGPLGSHAWVRFTAASGEDYIIDAAQRRCAAWIDLEPGYQMLYTPIE